MHITVNKMNRTNEENTKDKGDKYHYWVFAQTASALVIFCMIVVGNASILYRLRGRHQRRSSNVNYFIVQLAIADLFVGVFSVSMDSFLRLKKAFTYGPLACLASKYIAVLFIYSSTYLLVALSIDRWEAVVKPLAFTRNRNRGYYLVLGAWLLAFVSATPVTLYTTIQDVQGLPQCWIELSKLGWKIYMLYLTCSLLVIPALIIAVCYIHIVYTIWSKGQLVVRQQQKQDGRSRRQLATTTTPVDDDGPVSSSSPEEHYSEKRLSLKVASATAKLILPPNVGCIDDNENERRKKTTTPTTISTIDRGGGDGPSKQSSSRKQRDSATSAGVQDNNKRPVQTEIVVAATNGDGSGGASDDISEDDYEAMSSSDEGEIEVEEDDGGEYDCGDRATVIVSSVGIAANSADITSKLEMCEIGRQNELDDGGTRLAPDAHLRGSTTEAAAAATSNENRFPRSAKGDMNGGSPPPPIGLNESAIAKRLGQVVRLAADKVGPPSLPGFHHCPGSKSGAFEQHLERDHRRRHDNNEFTGAGSNRRRRRRMAEEATARGDTTAAATASGSSGGGGGKKRNYGAQQHGSGVIPKARIKTIKMTLVIVAAFILCWAPFYIINLCAVFGLMKDDTISIALRTLTMSLAHLNSAVNPIIFWLFSSKRRTTTSTCAPSHSESRSGRLANSKTPTVWSRIRQLLCCQFIGVGGSGGGFITTDSRMFESTGASGGPIYGGGNRLSSLEASASRLGSQVPCYRFPTNR